MKNFILQNNRGFSLQLGKGLFLLIVLLFSWPLLQQLLLFRDPTAGYIDPSIWLLVLLGIISFMAILLLSGWLLYTFWSALGLPKLTAMVSQFNTLSSWQQLGLFYASFALLLLAAVGCLMAVC